VLLGVVQPARGIALAVTFIVGGCQTIGALHDANASDSAVRRLARQVKRIDRLVRVARADYAGRPPKPFDGFPAGTWLLERARRLEVEDRAPTPLVMGRHLLEFGVQPGPDMDRLLDECPAHAGCRRLTAHLRRERGALFTFLHRDAIPATNFLAEQAIRPAVVNRKMSGGNNTSRGAHTQEVLMTVLHTARKRGLDGIALATQVLRDPASLHSILS
jgi:hypothetical protein